ncbi:Heterokaryon incompatibility protein 6, OR allele [Colletotrichum aenigma]|uniref:Heterokaryon incompatibility protein 6, OR allele n=1 Tax=Colletotrichum aenigma TaxID=1215731 RepID=UPI001872F308|nr:Heterokaryon incompatibility protein 6, OR allele [Colletotrichum aenigma]KAF5526232.1 Heterokaryon incompatibility protein 6, OR allele [Colletotrichum aenigma]
MSGVDSATFEAISYVWGTHGRNETIICDGKRLRITKNLRTALKRVRLQGDTRRIWADSICINQEDPNERGHQVALMGDIYSKATQVVICVGPDPDDHGHRASTLVDDVNRTVLSICESIDYSPKSIPYARDDDPLRNDQRWKSFAALLQLPWFQRGCVVQESGLAKSAIIHWGSSQISWAPFMRTWRWASRQAPALHVPLFDKIWLSLNPICDMAFVASHLRESVAWYPKASTSLITHPLEMMRHGHRLSLTDKRDRVYAFLALAQRLTVSEFQPDNPSYSQTFQETYLAFARKYLNDTKDATLLNYVHHNADTLSSKLPSWCPRWDLGVHISYITTPSHKLMETRPRSPYTLEILTGNVLRMSGVIVDSIAMTSETLTSRITVNGIGLIWEEFRVRQKNVCPYEPDLRLQALVQCLTGGRMYGRETKWYCDYAAYLRELFRISKDTVIPQAVMELGNIGEGEVAGVHLIAAEYAHNRKAVATRKGYYALGPGISEKGDFIAVLCGTRGPVVLRESTSKKGSYKIIGETLVASKRTYRNTQGVLLP